MQHLDGSGAWPSYIYDARFLKVNKETIDGAVLAYLNGIISTAKCRLYMTNWKWCGRKRLGSVVVGEQYIT
jgi:hypothetical protein